MGVNVTDRIGPVCCPPRGQFWCMGCCGREVPGRPAPPSRAGPHGAIGSGWTAPTGQRCRSARHATGASKKAFDADARRCTPMHADRTSAITSPRLIKPDRTVFAVHVRAERRPIRVDQRPSACICVKTLLAEPRAATSSPVTASTACARRRQAVWRRYAGGRPLSPRRIGSDLARRDGMVRTSPAPARPHGVWGLASPGSAWRRSGLPARRPEPRRARLRNGWDEKRGYVAGYGKYAERMF